MRNANIQLKVSLPAHDVEVPVERGGASGSRTAVMHVPAYPVTIRLSQADIEPLREALRRPQVVLTYLHLNVFLPAAICAAPSQKGNQLSRRRPAEARLLTSLLPEAFFFAYALVAISKDDSDLRQRIGEIVVEDDFKRYLSRFSLSDGSPLLSGGNLATLDTRVRNVRFPPIVYLVERAFRGAWTSCGLIPPTEGGSPWDYMRRYFYGRKSRNPMLALFGTAVLFKDTAFVASQYIAWWRNLLLGPPGSAARAFGLLPRHKK